MSSSLSLGLIITTVSLGIATITLGGHIAQKHYAQGVADTSALAGADTLFGFISGDPCENAFELAKKVNKRLSSCMIQDNTVTVRVRYGILGAETEARAGVKH